MNKNIDYNNIDYNVPFTFIKDGNEYEDCWLYDNGSIYHDRRRMIKIGTIDDVIKGKCAIRYEEDE